MRDYPIYDIAIDKEDYSEHGVFTVSLVNKPAIKSNFVYMSDEERTALYTFADEERGEIVGAMLIPNQLIQRYSEELGVYYIRFTEETIKDIQYKMSKDGFFNYFNIEHSFGADGVYMLETWIKEDEQDKSNKYGFDLPVGTMFMKAKIDDEYIKEGVKNGDLNGFSVELKSKLIPTMEKEQKFSDTIEELGNQVAELTLTVSELNKAVGLFAQMLELSEQKEESNEPIEETEESLSEEGGQGVEESPEAEVSGEDSGEPVVEEPVEEMANEVFEEEVSAPEEAVAEVAEEVTEEMSSEEVEVELSEEEAEQTLLSEQEGEEKEEEQKVVHTLNRTDASFYKKLDAFLKNPYKR